MTKNKARVIHEDHQCYAARKIGDILPWLEFHGMKLRGEFKSEKEGFIGYNFEIPGGGIRLEVLVPLDPSDESNFLVRFLRDRGPGLHHLTFHVESLPKLRKELRKLRVEPFRDNEREIVIHPKTDNAGEGVMWQYFGMHPWCPRCRAYWRVKRWRRYALRTLTVLTTLATATVIVRRRRVSAS